MRNLLVQNVPGAARPLERGLRTPLLPHRVLGRRGVGTDQVAGGSRGRVGEGTPTVFYPHPQLLFPENPPPQTSPTRIDQIPIPPLPPRGSGLDPPLDPRGGRGRWPGLHLQTGRGEGVGRWAFPVIWVVPSLARPPPSPKETGEGRHGGFSPPKRTSRRHPPRNRTSTGSTPSPLSGLVWDSVFTGES